MGAFLQKRRALMPDYAGEECVALESKYWIPPHTVVMSSTGEPQHYKAKKYGVYSKVVSVDVE